MRNALNFYIDGAWVAPAGSGRLAVTDPCTEAPFAYVALGDARDVERAVAAAKRAFTVRYVSKSAARKTGCTAVRWHSGHSPSFANPS